MQLNQTTVTTQELSIIRQDVFDILNGIINSKEYGVFCALHDPKLYDATDDRAHNCIGCNLNEYSQILVNSLKNETEFQSEYELFSRFLVNSYILNERIRVFTKILQLSDEDFNNTYPTLRIIMKWANFIKHPKAFMLVHSPGYTFDGSVEHGKKISDKNYIIVDQAFVEKFYSGSTYNNELYTTLANQRDVLVVFPDLPKLSANLGVECLKFIESILTTEDYRKILKDDTTFEKYFSGEDEE